MALKLQNYVSPQGVPAPDAYARIMQMIVGKTNIRVNVNIYYNEASAPTPAKPNVPHLQSLVELVPLTANPIWADAYAALKVKAPFTSAADI
jgi:hypothetical protein